MNTLLRGDDGIDRYLDGTFGYAGAFGYQEDSDSGLKLLGIRYYDASLGRFINRDPIKDGNNWYSYCGANPVTHHDSAGLRKHGVVIVHNYTTYPVYALGDDSIDVTVPTLGAIVPKVAIRLQFAVKIPPYGSSPSDMDMDNINTGFTTVEGKSVLIWEKIPTWAGDYYVLPGHPLQITVYGFKEYWGYEGYKVFYKHTALSVPDGYGFDHIWVDKASDDLSKILVCFPDLVHR